MQDQSKVFEEKIETKNAQVSSLQLKLRNLDHQIETEQMQVVRLKGELQTVEKLRNMYEFKVSFLSKETQIKQFMNSLLNKNISREAVEQMMSDKIKEEHKYLEELEKFQASSNELSEEVLSDFQIVQQDQEEIRELIDKQKKTLSEFVSKYKDLEQAINEYKEELQQLDYNKKKVADLDVHYSTISAKIESLNKSVKYNVKMRGNAQGELDEVQGLINQMRESIGQNQQRISEFTVSIDELQEKLQA